MSGSILGFIIFAGLIVAVMLIVFNINKAVDSGSDAIRNAAARRKALKAAPAEVRLADRYAARD